MESSEDLNNRLRVLKQAVLQEKERRKEIAALSESLKLQIRSTDLQISSIVLFKQSEIIEKKTKERDSAEEDLKKTQDLLKAQKAKMNPLKKSFSSKQKSILALQAQNEKLLEEYSALHSEHKEDELSIFQLKE
jgi:hypothetical protein